MKAHSYVPQQAVMSAPL